MTPQPTPHLDFFNEENFPNVIQRQRGIDLARDKTRLLLVFRENQTTDDVKTFIVGLNLVLEDMVVETPPLPYERINHSKRHFWVRKDQPAGADALIDGQTYKYLAQALQSKLYWVGPVYRYPGTNGREGLLCPSPNVLLLKLTPQAHGEIPSGLKRILDSAQLQEVPKRSQYLSPFRYFVLKKIGSQTVYPFQKKVLEGQVPFVEDARFENGPLLDPKMAPPTDPLYSSQWNLRRIGAEMGWAICSGRTDVVIWIIDEGVDVVDDRPTYPTLPGPHPDIRSIHPGINMDDDASDITKTDISARPDLAHGTWCAGIAGGITNNVDSMGNPIGIAGLAGGALGPAGYNSGCPIYPLVFSISAAAPPKTDAQVAQAFSFATRVHTGQLPTNEDGYLSSTPLVGSVANLSYAVGAAWDQNIINPKIVDAFEAGIVICASTGNSNSNPVLYPASHRYVIACGASDTNDNRVDTSSWGSNYGAELSVVAPGVDIPTTDPQDWPGGSQRGVVGDYEHHFWGTSAAAPHVAGLAALLLSKYPYLTPTQVRNIIERTAKKVGRYATGSPPQYPFVKLNGTWHEQMGYGLINVADALNYPADVMIRDTLADMGVEPSNGAFWNSPDIVIRPNLADPFSNTDAVLRGQDNYLFVRVTNTGPGEAINVAVEARIVPYAGTEFTYPFDWKTNPIFVRPDPVTATFTTVLPGMTNQVIAKFRISQADVDRLWDWSNVWKWHPCILAEVSADNDFRYVNNLPPLSGESPTPQRNHLAQRNLTVLSTVPGLKILYPFIMGSAGAAVGAGVQGEAMLHIDHRQLPHDVDLFLDLDPDVTPFPQAGSTDKIGDVTVEVGGQVVNVNGRRIVHLDGTETILRMQTSGRERYRLILKVGISNIAARGKTYTLHVFQKNMRRKIVGGATLVVAVQ